MTTAKGRYVVKPSCGRIEPLSSATIQILFTLDDNETDIASIRDKFAIYSVATDQNLTDKKEIDSFINENKNNVCQTFFVATAAAVEFESTSFRSNLPLQKQMSITRDFSNLPSELNTQFIKRSKTSLSIESQQIINTFKERQNLPESFCKKDTFMSVMSEGETENLMKHTPLIGHLKENQKSIDSTENRGKDAVTLELERTKALVTKFQNQVLQLEIEVKLLKVI
jgi:hypothetical protein